MDAQFEQYIRNLIAHEDRSDAGSYEAGNKIVDLIRSKSLSDTEVEFFHNYFLNSLERSNSTAKKAAIYYFKALKAEHSFVVRQGKFSALFKKEGYKSKIVSPPGFGLLRFSEAVFSRKTFEEVFQPVISDMQTEYYDALEKGSLRKAKWILVRGNVSFWNAFISILPIALLRRCTEIWKTIGSGV